MKSTMGMQLAANFWDNSILDEWEIPFGLWVEEIVFWLTNHIGWLLDAIKWPVDQLLNFVIDDLLQTWLPWPLVLVLFVLLGAFTRNLVVGLGAAGALLICGLLGNEYWDLTMETLGMIIVAVFICSLIGIPLGVLAARVDSVWTRLRPILDGMQVVHPFVYLLPIIFLFGVRRTPGVLATLVFAAPPLIRLTNLGIRQVPDDVVEAARAFGASERRVLREVQLPLARPAIMAGLNQTLLMSLSMVGIVAIIAGGGLGQPILRALATADIPTGAAAGAGLYFVGVLLDRISQPEDSDKNQSLFARIRSVYANRLDPDVPDVPDLTAAQQSVADMVVAAEDRERPEALSRGGVVGVLVGAGLALVSVFLDWGVDGGRISSWARPDDVDLPGGHMGLHATGGSWFAVVAAILAATLVALTIAHLAKLSVIGPPSHDAGLLALLSIALVVVAGAFHTVAVRGEAYTTGTGAWLAVAGGALATVAALALVGEVQRDGHQIVGVREVIVAAMLALFVALAGGAGGWILDQRSDAAEIAAELAANADGANQGGVAAEILAEAMSGTRRVSISGLAEEGPRLGFIVIILAVLSFLVAAGRAITRGRIQHILAAILAGLGLALAGVAIAWIASIVRIDTAQLTPGASSFLTLCGGLIIAVQGWQALTRKDIPVPRVEHLAKTSS